MADSTDAQYCLGQVRQFDRDRYLAGLFATGQDRLDLMALYAFNVEIARAREMVRDPMMGLVRLQWWRDAIVEIYAGQTRRHQVVQPLAAAIRRHSLSQDRLVRMIEAREADLNPMPPSDIAALLDYAGGTSASLASMTLDLLSGGAQPTDALRAAACQVGVAWALVGLLRAIPFQAGLQRTMLPRSLMVEAGLGESDQSQLKPSPALAVVVAEIAGEARRRLKASHLDGLAMPKRLRPAFLLGVLAANDLRRLERAGFNPFDPSVQAMQPGRLWRMVPAALLGRFWRTPATS